MFIKIATLLETRLAGKQIHTSLIENKTVQLWQNFMPERNRIPTTSADLYSVNIYPEDYFIRFDPARTYEKWAAGPVAADVLFPNMQQLIIQAGLYAVFLHKGSSSDNSTFRYIFSEWLPTSLYELDNRPHFEILGSSYKNNDVNSEEEIWIPVRGKTVKLL